MKKLVWVLALLLFTVACDKEPETLADFEEAGRKAYLAEDYRQAREYLRKAVALKSSDRDVLYFLGMTFRREYILDSALFYLKRADLLHPEDREINAAIYPIAAELREWETAIRAINTLIRTGDPLEKYRFLLADLNAKQGNPWAAFQHAQALIEAAPDNPDHHYQLAMLAHEIDSVDLALAIIDSAIVRFGPQTRFLSAKGLFLITGGEFEQAEKLLRPIYEADTTVLVSKFNLAVALSLQQAAAKKREAYRLYREIQQLMVADYKIDSAVAALEAELNIGN
ncbi:MAG: hypothetical protein JSW34_02555 [Candidatus Zixiibacteriota bacterium]|nr:MAG: hypothetical protein JSW34_02555 [candidate division Zixibacteria bacterium]